MSQVDLQRIQNDLDSMNQVIRRDRPYAAADVLPCVVVGLGAIVCMALLHWRLLSDARLCLLLSISPGMALWARRYQHARLGRAKRPVLWKEYKWSMIAGFVLVPTCIAWVWWRQHLGFSGESALATILFCVGLVMAMTGVMDPSRRLYLPCALLILGYSFLRGLLPPEQLETSAFALLAVACFGSAIAIAIAVRRDEVSPSEKSLSEVESAT